MTTSIRQTMRQEVAEGGSAQLTWKLEDEAEAPIPLAALVSLEWWHYNEDTGLVVNSRTAVNIKNLNGGTVHATTGACTLTVTPADNALVDPTKRAEWRVAVIKGVYNGGAGVVWKEIAYRVVQVLP